MNRYEIDLQKLTANMAPQFIDATLSMEKIIHTLLRSYHGWGTQIDVEKDEYPQIELSHFIENLDIYYPGANQNKLKLAIREKIKNLTCFKFRLVALLENKATFWNPLETTYQDFIDANANSNLEYRLTDEPYPTVDIINVWIMSFDKKLLT